VVNNVGDFKRKNRTPADKGKNEKKKKKKKKKILPKDLNAPVDPERWIPMKFRSYYKNKKKTRRDREMGKGASQGAVIAPNLAPLPVASMSTDTSAPLSFSFFFSLQPNHFFKISSSSTGQRDYSPSSSSPQAPKRKAKERHKTMEINKTNKLTRPPFLFYFF